MGSRLIRLDEFIAEYPLRGKWKVSYSDGTHLPRKESLEIGEITISASEALVRQRPILPFDFRPVPERQIETRFRKIFENSFLDILKDSVSKDEKSEDEKTRVGKSEVKRHAKRAKRIVCDQLAECMVRTGLMRPNCWLIEGQEIETDYHSVLRRLSTHINLVIVADTGALRRAAISLLHTTLPNVLIWTVVPVFVMNEVQRQLIELDRIWRESGRGNQPHPGKCDILRKRPQVSCISQELDNIRQWRPLEILSTLTEHLGQSNGQSRVDRLIIESMKNLKRDRGLNQEVFLLTGDKDMASIAALENQGCLLFEMPSLPSNTSSLRYNPHSSKLVLTPVHSFLWDLALVFGKISIESKENSQEYELNLYSREFLVHNVMGISEIRKDGPDFVE